MVEAFRKSGVGAWVLTRVCGFPLALRPWNGNGHQQTPHRRHRPRLRRPPARRGVRPKYPTVGFDKGPASPNSKAGLDARVFRKNWRGDAAFVHDHGRAADCNFYVVTVPTPIGDEPAAPDAVEGGRDLGSALKR